MVSRWRMKPAFSTATSNLRMLAFIRGSNTTLAGPGQIYVKLLPDGESVALTSDSLENMSPAFSPDGARIAYTGIDNTGFSTMDTWVVSPLGGQPQRLLTNAEGLTWIRTAGAAAAFPDRIRSQAREGNGQ